MKLAILVTSIVALALIPVGFFIAQAPAAPSPGLPFALQALRGALVVEAGVLVAIVAAVLCAIDAFQRRDWRSLAATVLLALLGLGGGPYLQIAVASTGSGSSGGDAGSGAPQPALLGAAVYLIVLGLPLATLLYGLMIERRAPLFASVGGLAILTLGALLVAAPPWVVFNPSNSAPVLAVNAPQTSADCAHGRYPTITLKNTGGGTVNWRFAGAGFDAVTTSPASGSLASGQTQAVMLVGAYTPSADRPQEVSVEFDSNGGNQRVIIPCGS